jgi:anti-sigma factor RsiW
MEERISQTDFEELSAYMDGELTEPTLSRVKGLLETSPAWAKALERLQAVDRAMEAYAAPAAPADLAGRVLRKTTRAPAMARPSLRWVVPLTAAAAIVVAVLVYGAMNRPTKRKSGVVTPVVNKVPPPVAGQNNTVAPDVDDEEEYPEVAETFVEDHLDFFRDMGVINNLDTIEAIDSQQTPGGGT